jgi:anti-anti-sigma regulatory factor
LERPRVLTVLERVDATPHTLVLDFEDVPVLDFEDVPLIDSTAAHSLVAFVNKIKGSGTAVIFAGARPAVRRILSRAGLKPPLVRYAATAGDGQAYDWLIQNCGRSLSSLRCADGALPDIKICLLSHRGNPICG